MRAIRLSPWTLPSFVVVAAALGGACAAPDDVPFPHQAGSSNGGSAGDSVGGSAAGGLPVGGAGGTPTTGGGGMSTGGTPAAGTGGTACTAGAAACSDACPSDPLKTSPGVCGCGKPESNVDTDGDGIPDCVDACPMSATATAPPCTGGGNCGSTPDEMTACQVLINGLSHRYAFDGSGTTIKDSKGTADATAINMTLADTGELSFTASGQYADLPNGLISAYTNVTLEAWVTWQGGGIWQRIFDFGEDSTGVENATGTGRSYLFVSPHGSGNFVRAVYKKPTGAEVIVDSTPSPSLTIGTPTQVVVVFDDDHDSLSLYVNGVMVGTPQNVVDHLSDIHDINNWLGRSQFSGDATYVGTMQEFRIYGLALSASQIAFSNTKGADGAYLTK